MSEGVRWIGSFVVVVAAHAGVAVAALDWATRAEAPQSFPPAAVMLELEPLPATPETTPTEAPPGPELSEVIPEPESPPPIEMPPPLEAAVTLPLPEAPPVDLKPHEPPKPDVKPEKKPPSRRAAPQAAPQQAAVAAAPLMGATPEPPSAALPTWKGTLLRHLERHKRYPHDAQRSRHEGVTYVRFVMSRDGRVLSARTERSARIASLDQEGLELLQRAQPLPPLPVDQSGESLELIVPVQFFMKR